MKVRIGDTCTVRFPRKKGASSLDENTNNILNGSTMQVCRVEKVIQLDRAEFRSLSNKLNEPNPIWENVGGMAPGPQVANRVVFVECQSGDTFFVDTEGTDIAKKIGHIVCGR